MAGTQMTGGWTNQNVDDQSIKEVADKAMTHVNQQSNSNNYLLNVRILSAKSQVVSGINYELDLLVAPSSCQKNQVTATDGGNSACLQEKEGGKREIYTVNVWEQPWLNSTQVTVKEVKAATGEHAK